MKITFVIDDADVEGLKDGIKAGIKTYSPSLANIPEYYPNRLRVLKAIRNGLNEAMRGKVNP